MAWLRTLVAAAIAGIFAHHGLKKRSLSGFGAMTAFVVGYLSMASSYRFGVLLLGFYAAGSRLTKVRADRKQQIDENYKIGGQRGSRQVLACSLLGTCIAVYYYLTFGDADPELDADKSPLETFLLTSYIAHYACCSADTWASELGVLNNRPPRLITSWRVVPPGTNGGVSLVGTLASIAGGVFIGFLYYVMSCFSGTQQLGVLVFGGITGLIGSVLDSVLGATMQSSWFHKPTNKVCAEEKIAWLELEATSEYEHLCGLNLLTNEQVNAVSVLLTTFVGGYLGLILFE